MLPVSLDVALLKLQLPDLVLRPGMQVVARVASRGDAGAASLVLGGALIRATVPDEVEKGQTLKLTVAETSPERIVLRMDAAELPIGAPIMAAQPEARALEPDGEPAGSRARQDDDQGAVSLVYETPKLGRLDLRVERGPHGIVVSLGTSPHSHARAEAGAEDLRRALEERTGVPAVVRITPRRQPVNTYA